MRTDTQVTHVLGVQTALLIVSNSTNVDSLEVLLYVKYIYF